MNEYIVKILSLETNQIGIGELMNFYAYASQFSYTSVTLNISNTNHVDANLSSIILAISHKLQKEKKIRIFVELGEGKGVFFRNGLISHLKGRSNDNEYLDLQESTIALTTFNPNDDELYCKYLRKDFFGHRGLENLNTQIKNNLRTNYIEVFNNVGLHAESAYPMFCCGQYFPEKHILKFTLVDLGVGFLKKIHKYTNGKIDNDKSAIIWATESLNTTKDISFGTGGTGLKELKKFCNDNNGSLHICSGKGYVNVLKDRTLEYNLPISFPGSIVSIIIRNI